MTVPVKTPVQGDIMESVLLKGDIGKLTPDERVQYYGAVCKSMGLNPLTKPFEFVVLNGKMQLYALRTCADQLRKINGVSLEIVSREVENDILTIHVRAQLPDGRRDEDLGAVAFPSTLKGEARANAELKAVTKAKRRATLSICGLGWLDETEVADIPAAAKKPPPPAPNAMLPPHDPQTGEVIEQAPQHPPNPHVMRAPIRPHEYAGGQHIGLTIPLQRAPQQSASAENRPAPVTMDRPAGAGTAISVEDMGREAAYHGRDQFDAYYRSCTGPDRAKLRAIKTELEALFPK